MQALVVLLLFVGMVLVMHGVYEQKLKAAEQKTRIEYRFVPRTYYEEQLGKADVQGIYKNMFNKESPWYDRNYEESDADKKQQH
jgi:hypothetical protein